MTDSQRRGLLSRTTFLAASVSATVAALVFGSAGIASASAVPGGEFEVCAGGSFAVDVWVNGNFFFDAPFGSCVTKPVPFSHTSGPEYRTFSVFVHNANPGIEITSITYDVNQGFGISVTGTPTDFHVSDF